MTDKTELKPCPFCRGKRLTVWTTCHAPTKAKQKQVICKDCKCAAGGMRDTTEDAITAWNTRHSDTDLAVAAALQMAAEACTNQNDHKWDNYTAYTIEQSILALIPETDQAALDAMIRAAEARGMREVIEWMRHSSGEDESFYAAHIEALAAAKEEGE